MLLFYSRKRQLIRINRLLGGWRFFKTSKMNKKGIKTTIVAIIIGLLGITIFVLWFLKKLDNSQLGIGLASLATFGTTIGLWLAKDSDKSHTNNK